ncbi:MAG: hypothetical protein KHX42_04445 [Prevotella sp.]|nr:hypothetical protein [Prevotella sp.]
MKKENRITPDAMQMALGELAAQLGGLKEEMAALKTEVTELKSARNCNESVAEKPVTRQEVESIILAMFEQPIGLKDLIKATGVDIIERLQTGLGDMFNARLNNHANSSNRLVAKVKLLADNDAAFNNRLKKLENEITSLKQTIMKLTKYKTSAKSPLRMRLWYYIFGGKDGWLRMFLTLLAVAFIILIALLIL